MSYARYDVVNLEFSDEELISINNCLNCTLPESSCRGRKNCAGKATTAKKIQIMAESGYSIKDVENVLGISYKSILVTLCRDVRQGNITKKEKQDILFRLRQHTSEPDKS